ncbi:MAG: hypothetical protein HQK99_02275 [Nitrospirae bacterium]|nr:hypothetical protein [Nitrospirota bacterium]
MYKHGEYYIIAIVLSACVIGVEVWRRNGSIKTALYWAMGYLLIATIGYFNGWIIVPTK